MNLKVVSLGLIEYEQALDIQLRLQKLCLQDRVGDILLLLEHKPVITIGRGGKHANILASEKILQDQGIGLFETNRGGDVTYHGPGQIVGYPILNLHNHGKDVGNYIWKLEEVFIRLLQDEYNTGSKRIKSLTGVWVEGNKITAIGCAVKRWITMHGFAFNVNTNLEHFRWINPCGITDKGVTSLERVLGASLDITSVYSQVIGHFCDMFNMTPECLGKDELYRLLKEHEDEIARS